MVVVHHCLRVAGAGEASDMAPGHDQLVAVEVVFVPGERRAHPEPLPDVAVDVVEVVVVVPALISRIMRIG